MLGQIDAEGVLRVMQLTADHDLTNEDELLRLSHTGLEVEKLKSIIKRLSLYIVIQNVINITFS